MLFAAYAGAMAQSVGPNGGQISAPASHQKGHKAKVGPLQVLFKSMNLTADQQKQIKDQLKSDQEDLKAFRKSNPGDRAGLKAEEQKIKAGDDQAMQKILNKDQLTTWTAWKSASSLKGFNVDGRALRAAKVTQDQMKQIRTLKGQARTEALMGIAKNPTDSGAVDSAKSKAIATYQTGLAKILSADQMTAYNAALGTKGH